MSTRRARPEDVEAIARLIGHYAGEGLLLARSKEEIRAGIDRFLVALDGSKIAGCVALESYGPRLAEIRSIAVDRSAQGRGLGAQLLRAAMAEGRRLGYARVFAMTRARGFFLRYRFQPVEREAIPEKIERDCSRCPRAASCRLMAVTATVVPSGESLPVPVEEVASPVAS
jgi:N-acetylglutamate synthase-like GNAT family acetyltransferase